MKRVVIVGGSAAGLSTAEALRRFHFEGEIVVLEEEVGPAYDRPPLSKQVLAGDWDEEKAVLFPQTRVERIGADLRLRARATRLDAANRRIELHDGTEIVYDEVVIATGVRPRRLPGEDSADTHTLRTLADCRKLGEAIRKHRRIAIVGAGFIGLEVAATARKLGAEATIVEPVQHPLADRLGTHTASRLIDLHASSGVDIRCGVGASAIARSTGSAGDVSGILTSDGNVVEAPVVLVAIGCVPNVEWLADAGLDLSNGVVCDAYCRAAPHVWAAGDIARWHHLGLARPLRVEHRMNASEQATVVAANIMGEERAFAPTPFFWTDHYDTKIQLAGVIVPEAEERAEVGAGDEDSFVRTFWMGERLVGVLGWNAAKAMMPLRRIIDMTEPVVA